MAKKSSKWMQKAVKRPGALTARAEKNKRSVGEEIKANLKSGTPLEKKQATLAKTFRKIATKNKK